MRNKNYPRSFPHLPTVQPGAGRELRGPALAVAAVMAGVPAHAVRQADGSITITTVPCAARVADGVITIGYQQETTNHAR
jgi:hypothetical protein